MKKISLFMSALALVVFCFSSCDPDKKKGGLEGVVEDGFYVNDLEDKKLMAFISKDNPHAFVHAFEICENLNKPIEEPFLSLNGREVEIAKPNYLVELKDNSIVDFLINEMEEEKD